jgi:hypothetical protein
MTSKELNKTVQLLDELKTIPTWTAEKKNNLKTIIDLVTAGNHEKVHSNFKTHNRFNTVGQYYIENADHQRRGCLKKYRGKKTIVICIGGNSWSMSNYIIAAVETK